VRDVIRYLKRKIIKKGFMLDIGDKSPLTIAVEESFKDLIIHNTFNDLDTDFGHYCTVDYVLYSHTIEHQFNPLYTLLRLHNEVMHKDSVMFIILPCRGKLLWDRGHYHEIDHYRMRLLLKRAGYEIISYELHKGWRPWSFYLTGVRPFFRMFFEFNAYYEVKKKQ
jgi:hypothetical protein